MLNKYKIDRNYAPETKRLIFTSFDNGMTSHSDFDVSNYKLERGYAYISTNNSTNRNMSSVVQKQIIHFLERDYKKYVQPSAFERKMKTNTEITN